MSYRDSVDIGITADREQTPDVQTIVEGMLVLSLSRPEFRPGGRRRPAGPPPLMTPGP